MDFRNFELAPFNLLDKEWALLTAGDKNKYNTMTVSWGSMGTTWGKPSVTVYVRPNRYTYEFIENSEYFSLSFYDVEYKKDLRVLGSISGRNTDKIANTNLTPEVLENGISFKEANLTIVCKKMYHQDMKIEDFPEEVINQYFKEDPVHHMYIGEVVEIMDNRKK